MSNNSQITRVTDIESLFHSESLFPYPQLPWLKIKEA